MSEPAFRLEETPRGGRYVWDAPDGSEGELSWRVADNGSLIAGHTFVPPQHREHGIALKLVERLVADARANDRRIVPLCPYIAAQFRRHPEWADVLAQ